jgi:hypothetical protein
MELEEKRYDKMINVRITLSVSSMRKRYHLALQRCCSMTLGEPSHIPELQLLSGKKTICLSTRNAGRFHSSVNNNFCVI